MKKVQTINEVVQDLVKRYPEIKAIARKLPQEEFATKCHLGLGKIIRNNYGLWDENEALMEDCKATHPDDASATILKKLWEQLQA